MKEDSLRLTKVELAKALNLSYTTLWRVLNSNENKARKFKLRRCPKHRFYSTGRYYYVASEVKEWLDYINEH